MSDRLFDMTPQDEGSLAAYWHAQFLKEQVRAQAECRAVRVWRDRVRWHRDQRGDDARPVDDELYAGLGDDL